MLFNTQRNTTSNLPKLKAPVNTQTMTITSLQFSDNQNIPAKYTCDGDNISPPLQFSDVPAEAKSLVLIVDDPDAPVGTWTHWVMWNIAEDIHQLAENSAPVGAMQGKTSSGQNVYGGPCPPSVDSSMATTTATTTQEEAGPPPGTHRYFFKLYALDSKLSIPSYSQKQDLEKAMEGHIIEKAELVGLYTRSK